MTNENVTGGNRIDKVLLAAFVLGVHIRNDVNAKEIARHAPSLIADEANLKLGAIRSGSSRVQEQDVVQALARLLALIGD